MKILIATVTAGGGHLAAAAALDETWREFRPADTVEKLDLVSFFSPLHRKIHADGYVKLVEQAPELWGMVFKKTDCTLAARRLNKWKKLIPSNSRKRFARYLEKMQPDAVLCTHYLPLEIMGELRRDLIKEAKKSPAKARKAEIDRCPYFVASIVTDFEAHALWMEDCVDLYCVAAEETKARLVARGAAKDRIVATGIPISQRFAKEIDGNKVRRNLGVRDDLPIVLVLSGGFGMGPVPEILQQLNGVTRPFQAVVVTGRNAELRSKLAAHDRKYPCTILGYAGNMHELMSVADLIISKPGGLTSSEALALGKPLLILNPIPGQEAANSDFLLERGAAAKINRVEDLPFRVEQLLGSKKLTQMSRAASLLGRPQAAETICREVVNRLKKAVAP